MLAAMSDAHDVQAVRVARLYYHQGLTTGAIAQELGLSRPKVSRLLSHARRRGLVEIRIHDPQGAPQALEAQLRAHYPFLSPQVVPVPPQSPEAVWLERVAVAAARALSGTLRPGQVLGLAWGTTVSAVSRALTPRPVPELQIVQLNGSASALDFHDGLVTDTMTRFARAFGARAWLFPVPTFFDDPATRAAMWRERSVRHVLALQERADVLLYSVGSPAAQVPSHVYAAGALTDTDRREMQAQEVAGDIATVFFRADGTSAGLPINARSSGPDLALIRRAPQSLCVVSGLGKVDALRAALAGRLLRTLIVDDQTAQALLRALGTGMKEF